MDTLPCLRQLSYEVTVQELLADYQLPWPRRAIRAVTDPESPRKKVKLYPLAVEFYGQEVICRYPFYGQVIVLRQATERSKGQRPFIWIDCFGWLFLQREGTFQHVAFGELKEELTATQQDLLLETLRGNTRNVEHIQGQSSSILSSLSDSYCV